MKNKKSLGQHWLKNREILDTIARLTAVPDVQLCLEIGPGLGTLTSSLLRCFSQVIAIEFDPDLARNLPNSFPGKNLQVINADILSADLPQLVSDRPYVVAGNIPYYITSPIIHKLLETTPRPTKIVLLIQKEVSKRLDADAGDHSVFSLEVQNLAEVELGPIVPAREFTPPPKVDSQVIILKPFSEPQIPLATFKLIKRGFLNPRKKLAHNLADAHHSKADWQAILQSYGINPDTRAQDLSLWDWESLYQADSVV